MVDVNAKIKEKFMQGLGIILYAFGMISCKQLKLSEITSFLDMHQSKDNLKNYSREKTLKQTETLEQTDLKDQKSLILDKVKLESKEIVAKDIDLTKVVAKSLDLGKGVLEKDVSNKRIGDRVFGANKSAKNEKSDARQLESKSKFRSNLKIDGKVKLLIPKKTAQEVYAAFESRVLKYKSKLIHERRRFNPRHYSLSIPFKKVSPIFTSAEQQSDIYAALGSDVKVITGLEKILNNLDLKYPALYSYGDTRVAAHLFNLLLNISNYTRKLINNHLNTANLDRIKNGKSVEDIIALNDLLEKFMIERDNAVKIIQEQILSLASKNKKEVLRGLKQTIGLENNSSREIQHASYSIIGMVTRIAYLVK
ncbi:Hypothetical protein BCD_1335 (plasmid) [Borrelia crocidurae DOU]|uniref:Uncharacterized protein n=2 Tax=Borrelia crocidurae TaxID=29520 RepID=W5SQS4_9SPIR|nr:Hypothetical protein BCD_1335 [Borrelia crocidurae DOU]